MPWNGSVKTVLDFREKLLPVIDQLGLALHQGFQVGDDRGLEVLDPVPLEEVYLHLDDLRDLVEVGLGPIA